MAAPAPNQQSPDRTALLRNGGMTAISDHDAYIAAAPEQFRPLLDT